MIGRPKKRPWFQLHLSTYVLLTLLAGLLLHLNMRPVEVVQKSGTKDKRQYTCREKGFPYDLAKASLRQQDKAGTLNKQAKVSLHSAPQRPAVIVINAAFCLVIVFAAASFFEWWIRDRDRRDKWWRDSQEATRDVPVSVNRLLKAKGSTHEGVNKELESPGPPDDPNHRPPG